MMEKYDRKIILEDGAEYYGYGFGDTSDKVCEIVFNTSMVGYQEIVSDPSYTYQAVVMTYWLHIQATWDSPRLQHAYYPKCSYPHTDDHL